MIFDNLKKKEIEPFPTHPAEKRKKFTEKYIYLKF
jgi:hypothetical protein